MGIQSLRGSFTYAQVQARPVGVSARRLLHVGIIFLGTRGFCVVLFVCGNRVWGGGSVCVWLLGLGLGAALIWFWRKEKRKIIVKGNERKCLERGLETGDWRLETRSSYMGRSICGMYPSMGLAASCREAGRQVVFWFGLVWIAFERVGSSLGGEMDGLDGRVRWTG